jgi:hypothetical protein
METFGVFFEIETNLHAVRDLAPVVQHYTVQLYVLSNATTGQNHRISDIAFATYTSVGKQQ